MMNEHLMFCLQSRVITNENSVPLLMLLEKEMENSEFGFVGRKEAFYVLFLKVFRMFRRHSDQRSMRMSMVVYSKTGNAIQ